MRTKFQINILPTQLNLKKIEEWLIEEEKNYNEGFYCNWTIIAKAFKNGALITFDFDEMPIGFLVWSRGEIHAEIDVLEIKPDFRNKGIGEFFFKQFSDYLKKNKFLVIKLFCAPKESKKFWKKMGFIKFPHRGFSEAELTYFKPLINIQRKSKNRQRGHLIEIWNVEPHLKNNFSPKWTWNIKLNNDVLILPIIHPCNSNWNMRWSKNGETIKEDKVKYFDIEENRVDYSPFIYIEKLIE